MTDNAKRFAEMVSIDEKLKAELVEKLTGKEAKEQKEIVKAIAKEKGFELEESDLAAEDMSGESDIDLEELSQVAGGGGCGCVGGGGGGGDDLLCLCVIYGTGVVVINGVEYPDKGWCECPFAGGGGTH